MHDGDVVRRLCVGWDTGGGSGEELGRDIIPKLLMPEAWPSHFHMDVLLRPILNSN